MDIDILLAIWYNIRGERKEGYTVKESEVKRMPNTAELAIEKAEKAERGG